MSVLVKPLSQNAVVDSGQTRSPTDVTSAESLPHLTTQSVAGREELES
jgi:hypothetical protein